MTIPLLLIAALWSPAQLDDQDSRRDFSPPGVEDLVDLTPRYRPGERWRTHVHTEKVVLTPAGGRGLLRRSDADETFVEKVDFDLRFRVVSVGEDEVNLMIAFDRIRWSTQSQGKLSEFDSLTDAPPEPEATDSFAPWRHLVGQPFLATLSARGEARSVRPMPSADPLALIPRRARQSVDLRQPDDEEVASPDGAAENLALLARTAGETQLRGLLRTICAWIPESRVRVGETWKRQETVDLEAIQLVRENHLTLDRVSGAIADIHSTIRVSGKAATGISSPAGKVHAVVESGPPGEARIRVNVAQGRLESLDAKISFALQVEAFDAKGRQTKIRQGMTAQTTIRTFPEEGNPAPKAN